MLFPETGEQVTEFFLRGQLAGFHSSHLEAVRIKGVFQRVKLLRYRWKIRPAGPVLVSFQPY